eukprot:SM000026S08930  [mRNA]  locus=s26:539501:546330:- [translate_table: standard]
MAAMEGPARPRQPPRPGDQRCPAPATVGDAPAAAGRLAPAMVAVEAELCSLGEFCLTVAGCAASQRAALLGSLPARAHRSIAGADSARPVYGTQHYEAVVMALRRMPGIRLQEVPRSTVEALKWRLARPQAAAAGWVPLRRGHLSEAEAQACLRTRLPTKLSGALMPFQREGVLFGLRRGGRCLIADDMGVGKTIQAIALASCFRDLGPLLVVCPASMRLAWAEEIERWMTYLSPTDIHLVFGRRDDVDGKEGRLPKVVVTSYTMLPRIRASLSCIQWGMVIVDESHNMRTSKKLYECEEVSAVADFVRRTEKAVLLSGTPCAARPFDIFCQADSLWPGLLGPSKYAFARAYCGVDYAGTHRDYSQGTRLRELFLLLSETIMIRRLKANILSQLPPKRRQVIRLSLSFPDIQEAVDRAKMHQQHLARHCSSVKNPFANFHADSESFGGSEEVDDSNEEVISQGKESHSKEAKKSASQLNNQEIGIAKLKGIKEWLANHPIFATGKDIADQLDTIEKGEPEMKGRAQEQDSDEAMVSDQVLGMPKASDAGKMVIFGHHLEVLDELQGFMHEKKVEHVRIDGSTDCWDRRKVLQAFQHQPKVKVALVGVTAGGVGLDFTSARSVVFTELPNTGGQLLQAEDRCHRLGQHTAVNVYIFCAKDTSDEVRWQGLSSKLEKVSTVLDGPAEASEGVQVAVVEDRTGSSPRFFHSEGDKASTDTIAQLSSNKQTAQAIAAEAAPQQSCTADALVLENLAFEVSTHTGRVHVYYCSGKPDKAFSTSEQNLDQPQADEDYAGNFHDSFRPEAFTAGENCTDLPPLLQNRAQHCQVAEQFLEEWTALRPMQRRKLAGQRLRPPLAEDDRVAKVVSDKGLRRNGSKRRALPKEELLLALPKGATLMVVRLEGRGSGGCREWEVRQARSVDGLPLCTLCMQACLDKKAYAPQAFQDLFCSKVCYVEYLSRTSPRYLRQALFQVERGVCSLCHLDCHSLVVSLKGIKCGLLRREAVLQQAPAFASCPHQLEKLVESPEEGRAWHADHILPVFEGGGQCGVENLRTLCVICHKAITQAQAKKRAKLRKKEYPTHSILPVPAQLDEPQQPTGHEAEAGLPGGDKNMLKILWDEFQFNSCHSMWEDTLDGAVDNCHREAAPLKDAVNEESAMVSSKQACLDEQHDEEALLMVSVAGSSYQALPKYTNEKLQHFH